MNYKKKIIVFTVVLMFLFVNFAFSASALPQAKETTKKIKAKTKVDKEPTVYIKAKGKKYHKKNCHVAKDKKGVKLSEAVKLGYDPCQVCKPPTLDPKIVKKLRKDIKKDPKK